MHRIEKINAFLLTRRGLVVALLCIFSLNSGLYLFTEVQRFPGYIQSRKDASGFAHNLAQRFFYFYYYTGRFPLATLNADSVEYTREGAKKEIADHGEDLIMEFWHWSRLGEHAGIFTYFPNAWLRGSPVNPTMKLWLVGFFTIGLLVLMWGFWRIKRPLFGVLLVLMVNVTPFFLHEVYSRQNIFAMMAAGFFIVLGLNVPVLYQRGHRFHLWTLLAGIASAMIIALFSEVRNEQAVIMGSLLLIFLLSNQRRWFEKAIYVAGLFVVFTGTRNLIKGHFNQKFEQTSEFVSEQGGHVYTGKRIGGHNFWHPVFCGLGDFDDNYGYEWNDRVAYWYATPILNEKYDMGLKYSGKYFLDNYYDADSLYYIKFDEIPEYEQVIKERVVADISNDPLWYLGILVKRVGRIFTVTIPVPYAGWLLIPLAVFLVRRKAWNALKIMILSFPLVLSSFVIYSGRGSTYNSLFVYFILAFLAVHFLVRWTLKEGRAETSIKQI